jgi:hypothetical protein
MIAMMLALTILISGLMEVTVVAMSLMLTLMVTMSETVPRMNAPMIPTSLSLVFVVVTTLTSIQMLTVLLTVMMDARRTLPRPLLVCVVALRVMLMLIVTEPPIVLMVVPLIPTSKPLASVTAALLT